MDRILRNDRYHRFAAYNPTIGTGIVMGIVAAFSANAAFAMVVNPAAAQFWTILEWLRLRVSADDTNSTSLVCSSVLDPTIRTGGAPGGSAITPVEHAFTTLQATPALVRFGAVTPADADAGAARIAGRVLKATGVAVGDEFQLDFDKDRGGIPMGSVVIAPGSSWLLHLWGAAMAADAPAFEAHLSYRQVVKRGNIK
jgi:hypothetical protein